MQTPSAFLAINDHFDIEAGKDSALAACILLRERWEASLEFCDSVINHIMQMAEDTKKRLIK